MSGICTPKRYSVKCPKLRVLSLVVAAQVTSWLPAQSPVTSRRPIDIRRPMLDEAKPARMRMAATPLDESITGVSSPGGDKFVAATGVAVDHDGHLRLSDELMMESEVFPAIATSWARDQSTIPSNIPPAVSRGPYDCRLDPYRFRADQLSAAVRQDSGGTETIGAVRFSMWWDEPLATPLGLAKESIPVDIANLTEVALQSSPYVQGILTEPQIRRSELVIADADFDALTFVEAKFADTNDPVGDALTTGDNSDRFRDHTFKSSAGFRKKTRRGASLEMVQRGGYQDNNSTFLIPNPQGTTRLEVNFTQPLMKDGGRAVNNTRVMLARIDIKLADSEVRSDLEDHLVEVTRAYWELYQSRAEWLQRNKLLDGAVRLHDILVARDGVDSSQRQILRARVAVKSRRSDLIRAETRIRNAQAQLRLLTGSMQLIQTSRWEYTPQDRPLAFPVSLSVRDATITALDHRPDVAQSLRTVQSVAVRVGAAKNQVLPRLDMILSSYVAGLADKTDTFQAWSNQFSEGRPSYAAGLLFEMPIGNRAAKARLNKNRWEFARAMHEFEQTTEVVFADVEIAVRETQTAFDEMAAKKQAIDAADAEVSYLQQRWELLPDPNESAVLLIEDLLDAQERLADEERAFVTAQVAYALSWVQLRKAMGVLLRFERPSHSPLKPQRLPADVDVSVDSTVPEFLPEPIGERETP